MCLGIVYVWEIADNCSIKEITNFNKNIYTYACACVSIANKIFVSIVQRVVIKFLAMAISKQISIGEMQKKVCFRIKKNENVPKLFFGLASMIPKAHNFLH